MRSAFLLSPLNFLINTIDIQLVSCGIFMGLPIKMPIDQVDIVFNFHLIRRYVLSCFNDPKSLLWQAVDELAASPAEFAVDPSRDFTRCRKLSFKDTIHLLLTMEGDCIQEELFKFFGRSINAPSKAAFCRQRQKLSEKALPSLLNIFNSKLSTTLFKGKYRLLACDGTTAEIFRDPDDLTTYYEPNKVSSRGFNMVYINAMYSILDNRFVDLVIQPGRMMNEFTAFCHMVDTAGCDGPPIIYFGDMGYASYNNFAHVIENGQFFLIRANDRILQGILGHSVDDMRDMDSHMDLIMSRSSSVKNMPDPGPGIRYKHLPYSSSLDYFDGCHSLYKMSLRIVRFELSDGVYENIITNLPDHEFSFEDFKDLYFLRWNEETAFRSIKHVLCLSNFHSKKLRFVIQEIWARAILYNFSSAIISKVVVKKKNAVHKYQVNYTEALKTCREFLRARGTGPGIDVTGLITRCIEPIRPGRYFPRYEGRSRSRRPFSFLYRN